MSASQDKKRRQAERESGSSPKTLAEREAAVKARKERRTWTIVGVLVALFVVVIVLLNTNLLYTGTTSVTVGDYKFTNAEYQYYYTTAYNNFTYQYGSYASLLGLDTSADLDEQTVQSSLFTMLGLEIPESLQPADEEETAEFTWDDYFRETALQNMAQVTAIWDAAVKAGYTLSEEAAEEINSTIASFETMATANNLRGADGYAAVIYGKGVTASLVRELLERAYIAEEYSADIYESFEYSADEINAYYDENADAFDAISFDYYLVEAEKVEVTETVTDEETGEETEETNEEVTDETMAEAKEEADSLLEAAQSGAAQGALSFAEAVAETMGDEAEATEVKSLFGYSVTSGYGVMAEWLLDSAREPGDMAVLENEGVGYYVVCFNSRSDNSDYNGVAFRHILVNVEDEDEDGEFSEEEIEAAEQKIQEIRDEWISDGETEDAFAALANANSDDTGSNGSSLYSTEGGLYEPVAKDQMVEPINDWIFDDARQSGDSEIIYVESSNYTGYHLVYFVGEDGYSYHDCLALYGLGYTNAPQGLRQPDYEAWQSELIAQFPVSVNGFVNWFAKV
ncbi:MAG TPA: peptidylprolyl isomerase [Candidatus Scatomorpha stercoravium]|nr:peptidylprolyl isomerase [Candidatus Scatomorpha stercoravium]